MMNTNLFYGEYEKEIRSLECVDKWGEFLDIWKELDQQCQEKVFNQMVISVIKYMS